MFEDAASNKCEPPGNLRCHKCAKYREGGDARRLKCRKRGKRAAIETSRAPWVTTPFKNYFILTIFFHFCVFSGVRKLKPAENYFKIII